MDDSFVTRLGYSFQQPELLKTALTHRSYHFENRTTSAGHFERLEFLGDAVLDLVLSETLMKCFPQVDEGTLSKWRASLVNEVTLAEIARQLELGPVLLLGKSEVGQQAQMRPRLLASALEAVLGALYLDGGLEQVRVLIERQFASRIQTLNLQVEYAADFKTRLQELSQKRFRLVPEYRVIATEGPEHAKAFTVEVFIKDQCVGRGQGKSRKSAEQEAAREALSKQEEV